MNNFTETKIFEKVRIEYVACNTGEVHHLEMAFTGWLTLFKFIKSLEKENKWKIIKIAKEWLP